MALRGKLYVTETEISFKMNEVAEPGQVVAHVTHLPDSEKLLRLATSGLHYDGATAARPIRVVGIIMDKVIPALSSTPANMLGVGGGGTFYITNSSSDGIFLNAEGQRYVGETVSVLRKGTIVTNQIIAGTTPSGGNLAYAGSGGMIGDGTTVAAGLSGLVIGMFNGPLDANGYAEVYIDVDPVKAHSRGAYPGI